MINLEQIEKFKHVMQMFTISDYGNDSATFTKHKLLTLIEYFFNAIEEIPLLSKDESQAYFESLSALIPLFRKAIKLFMEGSFESCIKTMKIIHRKMVLLGVGIGSDFFDFDDIFKYE